MAIDFAIGCHTSTTMDIKTVQGRSKHEGLSFFTITLPTFGKDFQKSLNDGLVSRDSFQGFSWRAGLPQFLGGFLEMVFDRTSGVLLDEPSIDAIHAIRQLTLIYSKVLLPCSDAREDDAMDGYVKCEQEVRDSDASLGIDDYANFRRVSNLLFSSLFSEVDRKVYYEELVPKHGPGATADKLRGNAKYRQRVWTARLERYFHSGSYLFSSARSFNEHYDEISFLEPGEEMPVKVISVPKTQKTPRIIAIEPTCMQYTQQALSEAIVQGIEERTVLDSLIGFADQSPNQEMAARGSRNGDLATLDLSEASDRVSNQLVREMLRDFPHLQGAVEACRSRRARVPGHGVIRLAKFASMGSALCFPIEAIVFTTLVFLGIEQKLNTRFTSIFQIKKYVGSVRVYGDDIICPVDCVYSVVESLEHFGARVGLSKSFWIGRFRESCGKEYYDGHDVSIVKVRRTLPTSQRDVPEVISLVSLRNQCYYAGLWRAAKWCDARVRAVLSHFPNTLPSSSLLGRHSFLGYVAEKEHEYLHHPLVKGFQVSSRLPIDRLDGDGALLKFFLKRGGLPSADRNHLERSGRPRAVDIKPRWARPY